MYGFLINSVVDSMGGVIDGGVGLGSTNSPCRAAIEKAQAELRLAYDVHEERRRELEFLEKGSDPLDFKYGLAASASVQSTSLTGQHVNRCMISEVRGSFSLTASPHGDSLESRDRLGATIGCEPNTADNFGGENQLLQSPRKPKYPRSNITQSGHFSQLSGKDLPIFHSKKGQAYRRRNRSRPNHDVARSSSTDIASQGTHVNDSINSARTNILDDRPDTSASKDILDHPNLGMASQEPYAPRESHRASPVVTIIFPIDAEKVESHDAPQQLNESSKLKGEERCSQTDGITSSVGSGCSCSQTSLSVDRNENRDSELCNLKVDRNGTSKREKLAEMENLKDEKIIEGKDMADATKSSLCPNANHSCVVQICQGNGFTDEDAKKLRRSRPSLQNEANCSSYYKEVESKQHSSLKSYMKENVSENSNHTVSSHQKMQASGDSCGMELTHAALPGSGISTELPTSGEHQLKVGDKEYEDRILAEAQILQAQRKRIADVSVRSHPTEYHKRSHWEFVMQEMVWLANDFAQERLWKITIAAQICNRVAFASHLKSKENDKHGRLRVIAQALANSVMEFWQSAGQLLQNDGISCCPESSKHGAVASRNMDWIEGRIPDPGEELDKDTEQRPESHRKNTVLPVLEYAIRFLQYNSLVTSIVRVAAAETSDLVSGLSVQDMSWMDHLTEENLFYVIPPGSTEAYRKSIESYLACSEEKGNNWQDDAEASMYNAAAEFEPQENVYEEVAGESVYYLPSAIENSRSLKIVHKKRRHHQSISARAYQFGGDFPYGDSIRSRVGGPQSGLLGKRSMNGLHVGLIPTKRMRTASRQRVVGPVGLGAAGEFPTPTWDNASSGDINSFDDVQSMLHGGTTIHKSLEVESGMAFDKQSIFDPAEVPAKPKKKKKAKHQATTYGQRWMIESMQNEPRDHLTKRLDGHQLESNELFVHLAKKPKLLKESCDNSCGSTIPMSGSITCTLASLSNMSCPHKLTKFIGQPDEIRKVNLVTKVHICQPGAGNEWTLYEDQALVVLVHDMGPNWELVSDAFNCSLIFKSVFRRPIDCKERHRALMDGPSVDGADSADDSGSSQPHRSTLPGIPNGSARQLFRQLQGPLEEDTIKSHFEKITLLGPRLTHWKKQSDNQDLKRIAPVHGSHVAALSQVIPNNVNGGVLTPLELCDISESSPNEFLLDCQTAAGLASPSHGVIPSILPPGGNASLQSSPGRTISGNFVSAAHPNGFIRDWKYGVPGTPSLLIDDQQRAQQYDHMLPSRCNQQSNLPISGADRNVSMLPGGGMGVMPGMNSGMPIPKPDFQGIASSAMLKSGTMVGMPSAANTHSGIVPGQGNSILKQGETVHLQRTNLSVEHRRQMLLLEMQMQVTQGNTQEVPPFSGLSSPFHNQPATLSVQNFPVHNQQQHQVSQHSNAMTDPQHPHLQGRTHPLSVDQQAFMQGARHQPQRMLQRQHRHQQLHFPAPSPLVAPGQIHSHLAVSSPMQNSSQIQSPASSQPVTLPTLPPSSPLTPQLPPHGIGQNSQSCVTGGMNQIGKQQPRQSTQSHQHQQFQQYGGHHPNKHQKLQSVNQAKHLKGIGSSIMVMQNLPLDPSHLNGLFTNQVNQAIEKGDQSRHLMQGHIVYSGSETLLPPQASGQTQPEKKPSFSSPPFSIRQVQQIPSHSDGSNQNQVQAVMSTVGRRISTQALPPTVISSHGQKMERKHQPPVKLVNQSQAVYERSVQQSHQLSSDLLAKSQSEHAQQKQQLVNNSAVLNVASGTPRTFLESSVPASTASSSGTVSALSSSPLMGGPIRSPQTSASLGNELLPVGVQGMSQTQLAEKLPPIAGTQRQQHQSNLQLPPSLPPLVSATAARTLDPEAAAATEASSTGSD